MKNLEIEKDKFYRYKSPIFVEDVNTYNILVSKKISSYRENYKYFIGYLYNYYKIKPLNIILPETSAYVKDYDGNLNGHTFLLKIISY